MSVRRISEDGSRLDRLSRNSTGFKEEFAGPRDDILEVPPLPHDDKKRDRMLAIVFVSMVFVGLGNKVFNKLQTVWRLCRVIISTFHYVYVRSLCTIIPTS